MEKLKNILAAVIITGICLVLPVAVHGGGTGTAEHPLRKATFIPHWVPQAQFAGYYMALHKGIYKKHGIDLAIINGGPERPTETFLADGKAHFGTLGLSMAIGMRDQGTRVVNIAQMLQRSALMLVAKKSSGIRRPEDLDGRKVGLWGGAVVQVQPLAFFRKFNVKPRIVRQSYSVNLFLRDGVAAASAMWYNEYHTILMAGLNPDELTTFFFHEYGLNFPEDGIYTLEATFNNDPELCRNFVKASLEGWHYAFSHPGETLDVVMENLRKARIPASRVHQKWMLERVKDLMAPREGGAPEGVLLEQDYRRVTRILRASGFIKKVAGYDDFFRRCVH
jgi:NitT/TauT family transport system substrate-binding protein